MYFNFKTYNSLLSHGIVLCCIFSASDEILRKEDIRRRDRERKHQRILAVEAASSGNGRENDDATATNPTNLEAPTVTAASMDVSISETSTIITSAGIGAAGEMLDMDDEDLENTNGSADDSQGPLPLSFNELSLLDYQDDIVSSSSV